MADRIELPPLPEAKYAPSLYPVRLPDYCYTDAQMHAYAEQHAAGLRAELERKSDAIQRLWRERDDLRARNSVLLDAARSARAALSELLMTRDPVVYSDALRLLDAALGPDGEDLLTNGGEYAR